MKKNTRFKIAGYSAAALTFISCGNAGAQIIYHDIDPDIVWNEPPWDPEFYFDTAYKFTLDVDLDGDLDFVFKLVLDENPSYSSGTYKYVTFKGVGYGQNRFAFSGGPGACLLALEEEEEINPVMDWVKQGDFFYAVDFFSPWWDGFWGEFTEDKYAGFKFRQDGLFYYGWVRLDVHGTTVPVHVDEIRIKDFAYSTIPASPIAAGDNGGCYPPSVDGILATTSTTATVDWSPAPNADKYQIRYRQLGGLSWTLININDGSTSKTITGLNCNTSYEWKIRSKCDADYSSYSNIHSFTTSACRESDIQHEFAVHIFPNPANDMITIDCPTVNEEKLQIVIIDLTGKIVMEKTAVGQESVNFDVSNLPAGTYIVHLISDSISATEKIIIQ